MLQTEQIGTHDPSTRIIKVNYIALSDINNYIKLDVFQVQTLYMQPAKLHDCGMLLKVHPFKAI